MRDMLAIPRISLALVTLSLFALVIAGCGGGDGGETSTGTDSSGAAAGSAEGSGDAAAAAASVMTCNDIKGLSQCQEHGPEAIKALGEGFYKDFCVLGEGVWGTDPCPADNQLATCDDGAGNVTHYYTDGGEPWDMAKAEKECKELIGKLTAH